MEIRSVGPRPPKVLARITPDGQWFDLFEDDPGPAGHISRCRVPATAELVTCLRGILANLDRAHDEQCPETSPDDGLRPIVQCQLHAGHDGQHAWIRPETTIADLAAGIR